VRRKVLGKTIAEKRFRSTGWLKLSGVATLVTVSRGPYPNDIDTKDKIALPVAILLGTAFDISAYWVVYGRLFMVLLRDSDCPSPRRFIADQRKILIWQAKYYSVCTLCSHRRKCPYGGMEKLKVSSSFICLGLSGLSFRRLLPFFLLLEAQQGHKKHQVVWLFLGWCLVALVRVSGTTHPVYAV